MKNEERINAIEEAMEMIAEARELVSSAISGSEIEGEYEAYGQFGFQRLLGEGNPYDKSLNDVIEDLNGK